MQRSFVSTALVVLALAPVATLVAQEPGPPLEPGARVRVTAPDLGIEKQQATFQALRGDTLVVMADSTMYYALGSITRFDVYRGRKSHWKTGLAIGAVLGAIVGGAAGYAYEAINDEYTPEYAAPVAFGALAGAAVVGALGAGVGAIMRTDRWEEVPLDQLRVSFVPRRDGFALGFAVAF